MSPETVGAKSGRVPPLPSLDRRRLFWVTCLTLLVAVPLAWLMMARHAAPPQPLAPPDPEGADAVDSEP